MTMTLADTASECTTHMVWCKTPLAPKLSATPQLSYPSCILGTHLGLYLDIYP